ncbi:small integral membrane protein 22 isoform X1 [Rousettus aegyptiacus]|uniref:small integral membrane protein 22 isoform X1 n=1 Tax=Rousettus aegyptiacus TaxID=9407 RepID=UPI000788637F|nr:small integral membrane protein 22 isoform X1 [Rousettus aegyptiacus]
MDNPEELQPIVEEVLGKLKSSQPFQSTWDTAAFVVFLTFVGECALCLWPVSLPCQVPGGGPCLDTCPVPRHCVAPAAVCLYPLLLLPSSLLQIPSECQEGKIHGSG